MKQVPINIKYYQKSDALFEHRFIVNLYFDFIF